MATKLFVDVICPICHESIAYSLDPVHKTVKPEGSNIEWLQTKRGVKHYFHTSCYENMVHDHKSWID